MKLLDKLKNAIFEDDELEDIEEKKIEEKPIERVERAEVVKKDNNISLEKDEVVKQIDIEKTIPKKIEIPIEEQEPRIMPKREHRKTPVIFDEEDFILEDIESNLPKREVVKKEEPKKPLYSGYRDDKTKEKFKPSPVISPVYGFVGVSPVLETPRNEELSSFNEMFAQEKEEEVTLDKVREKAYGIETKQSQEDDDLGLLYDMEENESPAISKITIGDAEEYFDDLGLEYNVDYKDSTKEKQDKRTREIKNKELSDAVEEKIKKEEIKEQEKKLEITKENIKPKTAKEIKKIKKITDLDIEEEPKEEPDEKNLYDLIDMMYESKE